MRALADRRKAGRRLEGSTPHLPEVRVFSETAAHDGKGLEIVVHAFSGGRRVSSVDIHTRVHVIFIEIWKIGLGRWRLTCAVLQTDVLEQD